MIRDLAVHIANILLVTTYGLVLAESNQIEKGTKKLKSTLNSPEAKEGLEGLLPEAGLSETETQKILEVLVPKYALRLASELEESAKSLLPEMRGVSRLLLGTDFVP